jgi:hypothetical protein
VVQKTSATCSWLRKRSATGFPLPARRGVDDVHAQRSVFAQHEVLGLVPFLAQRIVELATEEEARPPILLGGDAVAVRTIRNANEAVLVREEALPQARGELVEVAARDARSRRVLLEVGERDASHVRPPDRVADFVDDVHEERLAVPSRQLRLALARVVRDLRAGSQRERDQRHCKQRGPAHARKDHATSRAAIVLTEKGVTGPDPVKSSHRLETARVERGSGAFRG